MTYCPGYRPFRPLAHVALAAAAGLLLMRPAGATPHVLFDQATGQVLSAEDAVHRWHPASLTKLMTARVAFRMIAEGIVTLDSPVRVSKRALARPPSKMGYPVGSVMTLENALKMLLVKSANDIAVAIAESLAGTEADFVAMMNDEARRLGMRDSVFVNPHGLHDPAQVVTARDMALLARAIRQDFPQYLPWYAHDGVRAGDKVIEGFNMLLGRYAGADGMKTGFVCASGYNQVASATRNGRTIVAVIFGAPSMVARAEESAALLERGFAGMQPLGPIAGLGAGAVSAPADDNRSIYCPKNAANSEAETATAERITSPLLAAKAGVTNPVRVGLGKADGPVPPAAVSFVLLGGVPVPTPRPEYTPADAPQQVDAGATAVDAQSDLTVFPGSALRGTIPVPTPRPAS